jgi:hypothetical protein
MPSAPDAWHGFKGFCVNPAGFWSCFGLISPFYTSISFRMGMFIL